MELFQIGANSDSCKGLESIVRLVKKGVFPIVQIVIPIILIVMGTVDLGKAVISSDDKEVKRTLGDSNNYNQYIGLALDNLGKKVLINKINKLLYWIDISFFFWYNYYDLVYYSEDV